MSGTDRAELAEAILADLESGDITGTEIALANVRQAATALSADYMPDLKCADCGTSDLIGPICATCNPEIKRMMEGQKAPGEEGLREQLIADFNAYISRAIAGDGQFGAIDLAAIALRRLSSADLLLKADYEEAFADHRRLVREIDVALNGDGAAKQASLCDLIPQIKELAAYRRLSPSADLIAAAKAEQRERCAKIVVAQADTCKQVGLREKVNRDYQAADQRLYAASILFELAAALRSAGGE